MTDLANKTPAIEEPVLERRNHQKLSDIFFLLGLGSLITCIFGALVLKDYSLANTGFTMGTSFFVCAFVAHRQRQ